MPKIMIKYRGGLAETIGKQSEQTDADTVKDVITHIKKEYGAQPARTAKSMVIAVDNVSILKSEGYKTKLKEGSEVSFLPVSGGG
jgi:molybdopterin converting factor small subunit